MLSCKEVSHLLSESQDRKLNLSEKMHLEMHLAICRGCRNFKEQMNFLRQACQHYVNARKHPEE
jgi:predicted anti-sigma-YlaC factor YlaD